MRNCLLILLALFVGSLCRPAPCQAQQKTFPSTETFRLAKNQFTHGQYEEAIVNLQNLIYPLNLDSEAELIEARRILAIAYYLTDRKNDATAEFTKLLYLDPLYKLDPFLVSPPIIEFFEQIRKQLKSQLDPLISMQQQPEANNKTGSNKTKPVRVNYHYHNRALAFFPFGIGQLQNDHQALGYTSMALQISFLALNIISGVITYRTNAHYANVLNQNARGDMPWNAGELEGLAKQSRAMTITNIVSGSTFLLTWALSTIHANYYYEPYSTQISNEEIDQALIKKAAGSQK